MHSGRSGIAERHLLAVFDFILLVVELSFNSCLPPSNFRQGFWALMSSGTCQYASLTNTAQINYLRVLRKLRKNRKNRSAPQFSLSFLTWICSSSFHKCAQDYRAIPRQANDEYFCQIYTIKQKINKTDKWIKNTRTLRKNNPLTDMAEIFYLNGTLTQILRKPVSAKR